MRSYLEQYKSKLITADQAAKLVKSDFNINYAGFHGKPIDFDKALGARAGEPGLERVRIKYSGGLPPAPSVLVNDPKQKTFNCASWYYTLLDRYLADRLPLDHLPLNYHDTNAMSYDVNRRPRQGDLWCGQATPMDKHGNFNFGISNTDCRAKALNNKIAIIEVNNTFPTVLGGFEESIHISEIDYVIEGSNTPIVNSGAIPEPTPEERIIAQLIVEEITDGCCLQLGIGALPNTIGLMIADSDLKDLGIQTEMFCDTMVNMYEAGKITNARKKVDRYKSTFSFGLGTQETFEFMDNNSRLASCPVEYVNHPARIAMQDNIISINNILEIDLLSQVCSESKGTRHISGTGGQLDWVHGAYDSYAGKSFLAFSSTYTDKEGNIHSRIRPLLTPGAAITVPRHSVHWLVTEYGKANMKGKSIWERVESLINLAHPDFRDELLHEAEKLGIWTRTNMSIL